MSICDSEENRKKLAWLVPGYILLAWFFCVLFQPLGIHTPPSSTSSRSSNYHDHDKNYEVIYLDADASAPLCNNGMLILEEGAKSAMIIRLGRRQHVHLAYKNYNPFNCSLQVKAGKGLDGVVAVVEEMDLREHYDVRQPGGHAGSSVCLDYLELYSMLDGKNSFEPMKRNKLCGSWKVIGNEGLTSHGTQKNLIGYCYDKDINQPGHNSCGTNHVHINTVVNSNYEDTQTSRYNSNGLNIGKGDKGFTIVVTGYKHPKKPKSIPKKHENPSVARMQTQWVASTGRNEESGPSPGHKYANVLFPNSPKQFNLKRDQSNLINNFKPNSKAQSYQNSNWDPELKESNYFPGVPAEDEEDGTGCSDNEFMCQVTEYSNKRGMLFSNRCIWKRLKCDSHQNCGFTYNNDEINCSLIGVGGIDDPGGDENHNGVNGNQIPWSISTMSLLIIIYLAIVLILVLVTMLLLRWHRALRTPLDVLSESRYTTALGRSIDGVTTVASTPHGFQSHGYGELTITSTNLEAALAEADPSRSGDIIDGAIAGVETSATGRTPGTVSIMVMYRPQKSPKIPLGAAELPPSYDSLFAEENPPNYSRIIENVNLPAVTEDDAISTVEDASNGATSSLDATTQPIIVRNENQISINGILSRDDNPSISLNIANTRSNAGSASCSLQTNAVQEPSLPSLHDSNGIGPSTTGVDNESSNSNCNASGCDINTSDGVILEGAHELYIPTSMPISTENRFRNTDNNTEDHCQCDCDHTDCNNESN